MNKRLGARFIIIGILMLLISVGLAVINMRTDKNAGEVSEIVLEELSILHLEQQRDTAEFIEDSSITDEVPDYVLRPELEMPEQEVDDIPYIGVLEIPELRLALPIIGSTQYSYLRTAPCRLYGSAYLDNLVIGAHNYQTHFGKIKNLGYGDQLIFTDLDGNRFVYAVSTIEILQPEQIDELCAGEWPLTLYTCTLGGQSRIVVRCERIEY